jgi:hypothetical protein
VYVYMCNQVEGGHVANEHGWNFTYYYAKYAAKEHNDPLDEEDPVHQSTR